MSAIAFAGSAPFGAAILDGILEKRNVALVISQPDRPAGRGRKMRSPAVAERARQLGIELIQPEKTHDDAVLERLQALGVTTIVVAAFGQMIREPLLSEYLMLNVHGSVLPEWRGAAPIERSIMANGQGTGVAIMRMDAGLDTGGVFEQQAIEVGPDDDAGAIYERAARVGTKILHRALDANDAGSLTFTDQPEEGVTYAHKITAEDRMLDTSIGTQALHNRIRALSPHIGVLAMADGGTKVTLWSSRPGAEGLPYDIVDGEIWHDNKRLVLGCSDGPLEILELQPSGKRRMPAADWLRGLREPIQSLTPPQPVA
jgi:methionyl-tRNA formyltransferase